MRCWKLKWSVAAFALVVLCGSSVLEAAAPATRQRTYYRAPARTYSVAPRSSSSGVWPFYPNYGNPVGAAYSRAAGMRQGQWFGTFGLHPADAKARGAY